MKLTKQQLRKIIKEELDAVLDEMHDVPPEDQHDVGYKDDDKLTAAERETVKAGSSASDRLRGRASKSAPMSPAQKRRRAMQVKARAASAAERVQSGARGAELQAMRAKAREDQESLPKHHDRMQRIREAMRAKAREALQKN